LSADALGIDGSLIGINGSPTRVVKIETPKVTRGGRVVFAKDEAGAAKSVDEFIDFLKTKELI
jgi:electron transfer flavoprotein beta subunit